MNIPIPKKYHLESLKIVAEKTKDLEYVIFYGTLLGVTREGDILEKDDDVDILLNMKDRDKCFENIQNSGFEINSKVYPNKTPYFFQARKKYGEYISYVDFYLYDDSQIEGHIVDRWNFLGMPEHTKFSIHIPKNIIFPINQTKLNDFYVNIPADSPACCRYLYGEKWMVPLKKKQEYGMEIVNNKPQLIIK